MAPHAAPLITILFAKRRGCTYPQAVATVRQARVYRPDPAGGGAQPLAVVSELRGGGVLGGGGEADETACLENQASR